LGDLICYIALLHQKQRTIVKDEKDNEYIIATLDDYQCAKEYAQSVFSTTFIGLTKQQLDVINGIKNSFWKHDFFIKDVQSLFGYSYKKTYNVMEQLEELGFVSAEKKTGSSTKYSIIDKKSHNPVNLPESEEILKIIEDRSVSFPQFLEETVFNYYKVIK
jgi:hypothetical protein